MKRERPAWLPPTLELREGYTDKLENLRAAFQRHVLGAPLTFGGQPVNLNMRPFAEDMPECFWHLVGRGQNRQMDDQRAVRLPWLRAVLDNARDGAVRCWDGKGGRGDRQICRYVWLYDHDYFIVLAPARHGDGWFLVTAHIVGGRRRRRELEAGYRAACRQKLGPL
jgi:hypothetical protein